MEAVEVLTVHGQREEVQNQDAPQQRSSPASREDARLLLSPHPFRAMLRADGKQTKKKKKTCSWTRGARVSQSVVRTGGGAGLSAV